MADLPSDECLEQVIQLVQEASRKTMEVYAHAFDVVRKEDGSPLTEADLASHSVLVTGLRFLLSDTPVISEESDAETREGSLGGRFWLVDPLDGTKEFVKRTDEFTVNVALIRNGLPTLGVVEAPALGTLYAGIAGKGACRINPRGDRDSIHVNHDFSRGLRVVGSRSHGDPELMDRYLKDVNVRDFLTVGSSLKFCRIAEGEADLYPRFGRTMEWDTAAGHAVLLAAGGRVDTLDGKPLLYGKPNLANPHFVARAFPDDSAMD
jgi:3'(2'), 5'-bisphosphate nucleotidase